MEYANDSILIELISAESWGAGDVGDAAVLSAPMHLPRYVTVN